MASSPPAPLHPIGMSSVRPLRIDGNALQAAEVDILDGTPLLDVKGLNHSARFS